MKACYRLTVNLGTRYLRVITHASVLLLLLGQADLDTVHADQMLRILPPDGT